MYSPTCCVKRSLSVIVLDIWITISFLHQILDYTEMSMPVYSSEMHIGVFNFNMHHLVKLLSSQLINSCTCNDVHVVQ